MPARVRGRAFLLAVATAVVAGHALVFAGFATGGNGGLLPPPAHSPNAHRITQAYIFVLVFTGAIFLLVEGALIAFVVRYRRGWRARTVDGPQIHGSSRLELIWTVVPVVILAAIGTFVFYLLPGITDAPSAKASDQTTITVEGRQFYWMFRYPNGAVSIGTMIAPADQVVHETVVSPDNDVNHSWWVPNLGGKVDAIPGKINHTWFQAPAGIYIARCAELCGIQHAKMLGHVHVVPRADYDRFLAERRRAGLDLGKEEFTGVCETCHRLNKAYVGPALGGNPLLTDRKGLETILRQGVGKMPPVGSDWSDAQIDALVAYTKTLEGKSGGAG
jgi:cytochrome c oxidase subunit II